MEKAFPGQKIELNSTLVTIIEEPPNPKVTARAFEENLIEQARMNAVSKPVMSNRAQTSAALKDNLDTAWRTRFDHGFLPFSMFDEEGKLISAFLIDSQPVSYWPRWDRSLESLLGPLQYLAPDYMKLPTTSEDSTKPYARFGEYTKMPDNKYVPIYAAAYFCMNLNMYALGALEGSSALAKMHAVETSQQIIIQETLDSKSVANCWRFFEERVQYPVEPADDNAKKRHDAQEKRCQYDFQNLHIITLEQYKDCKTNGRSELQARFDMANRIYSEEYQQKFIKYLGATQRAIIIGLAMAEAEQFQQTLLMQRQIMSTVMASTRAGPIDFNTGLSFEVKREFFAAVPNLLPTSQQKQLEQFEKFKASMQGAAQPDAEKLKEKFDAFYP
jgi:hypothetical protein